MDDKTTINGKKLVAEIFLHPPLAMNTQRFSLLIIKSPKFMARSNISMCIVAVNVQMQSELQWNLIITVTYGTQATGYKFIKFNINIG